MTKREKMPSSNLVWLASYPRSGNTFLRLILNNNFAKKSFSIYNDLKVIGRIPEIAEIVGHQYKDWSFLGQSPLKLDLDNYSKLDAIRYQGGEPFFVKTHSAYHQGFSPDKVIYIYRDGRAVMDSYASYQVKFNNESSCKKMIIANTICRGELPDRQRSDWDNHTKTWGEHHVSWAEHPAEKILFLKYEDLKNNYLEAIKQLALFLNLEPVSCQNIEFKSLQNINKDFFRAGGKTTWEQSFDEGLHALFWILNYRTMGSLGYRDKPSPVCRMLNCTDPAIKSAFSKERNLEKYLNKMDIILMEVADIVQECLPQYHRHDHCGLGAKLEEAYKYFLDFYNKGQPHRQYRWIRQWKRLLFNNKSQNLIQGR